MPSVSRIVQNRGSINGNSYHKEWKDKVADKVAESLMPNESVPSESLVIHCASEIVFDYHDTVNIGRLWADNRNPNDDDIDLFARIVLAILSEYNIIEEHSNYDEHYNRVYADLKNRVKNSDKFENINRNEILV